jgi:hypothetical protein|nr:MAG TPA: hypothetical protein [Caudoviricetes sp.]
MKKLDYSFLECARQMPPMKHIKSEPFDITQSEVAKWLVSQPDIMQKIFDMTANHHVITYDVKTQTWRGAE